MTGWAGRGVVSRGAVKVWLARAVLQGQEGAAPGQGPGVSAPAAVMVHGGAVGRVRAVSGCQITWGRFWLALRLSPAGA